MTSNKLIQILLKKQSILNYAENAETKDSD
jgi:hypothetical protein